MTAAGYRRSLVAARKEQLQLSQETVRRVDRMLRTAAGNLQQLYRDLPAAKGMTKEQKILRGRFIQDRIGDLKDLTTQLHADYGHILGAGMGELAQAAAERERKVGQMVLPGFDDATLKPISTRSFEIAGQMLKVDFSQCSLGAIDSVLKRVYGDGLKLSDRIWKLDAFNKTGIEDRLLNALATGQSAKDLAGDLRGFLVDQDSDNARYRAMRLARTELNNAYREASIQAALDPDTGKLQPWIRGIRWSLSASHTEADICDLYASDDADGLGEGVYLPNDVPTGHAHCFPAGTVVVSPGTLAATRRWFSGEVTEILTASGNLLTGTNNHPVLTPDGWVPLGLLQEGGYVVSSRRREGPVSTTDPDDNYVPALIEDITEALFCSDGVVSRSVPTTAEDFHGDGAGGEVCVIGTNRSLWRGGDPALLQPFLHQNLTSADVSRLSLDAGGAAAEGLETLLCPAYGGMSGIGGSAALLGRPGGKVKPVSLGDASDGDARLFKALENYSSADSTVRGEGFLRLAGEISADEKLIRNRQCAAADLSEFRPASALGAGRVEDSADRHRGNTTVSSEGIDRLTGEITPGNLLVRERKLYRDCGTGSIDPVSYLHAPPSESAPDRVKGCPAGAGENAQGLAGLVTFSDLVVRVRKRSGFSGNVFNLQTIDGYYIANNIVVHNCMCFLSDELVDYPGVSIPKKPAAPDDAPDSQVEYYARAGDPVAERELARRKAAA